MANLSRRSFFASSAAGLAAAALPVLRPQRLWAGPAVAPKRLMIMFSGCGTPQGRFWPTGGETDFTLSPILAPLATLKNRLLVLKGVDQSSTDFGPGNGHSKGCGHILTGTPLAAGGTLTDSLGVKFGYPTGISVDQRVANAIGKDSRIASIQAGVRVETYNPIYSVISYRGESGPLPPDDDPFRMFGTLFGTLTGTVAERAKQMAERKSVLDNSRDELKTLLARVGKDDQARLSAHIDSIAEVERSLIDSGGAGCTAPALPAKFDVRAPENFPKVSRMQLDMMAVAFACDVTRVGTLMYAGGQNGQTFNWLGLTGNHHGYSHDTSAVDALVKINTWYASELAYFANKLASMPDVGGGSVLDNTVIVWVNELGDGATHQRKNIPFVIVGGDATGRGPGGLRMGRYLQYTNAPHNNLWVSICNALGVPTTTFGDPRFCTGALPKLV